MNQEDILTVLIDFLDGMKSVIILLVGAILSRATHVGHWEKCEQSLRMHFFGEIETVAKNKS